MRPITVAGALTLTALAMFASAAPRADALNAEIRYTAHDIPHIKAADWSGAGFGYGYAFAKDNICTIADSYVTVDAERSTYFGPDGSWTFRGNGFSANNLNSDFFFQRINDTRTIENLLDQPPPDGPEPEVRQAVRGYVAGYNKYLIDVGGVGNIPDPRCRGAAWVHPITEIEAYRRFYQLALLASQGVAFDSIAKAAPPYGGAAATVNPATADPQGTAERIAEGVGKMRAPGIGSNAFGLGKDATSNGKGIVLGNPHFPWIGSERFYEAQITIPGKLNVSGASLYGVPVVLIGHTDNLAWSHTVSAAYRFTPYQETINPLNPTQYLYDGQWKDMKADHVTVMEKTANGLQPVSRTLYSTRHGPVLSDLTGVPLPWTPVVAFSMRDVNAANFRYLNHFFEVDQAQSVERLDQIERTYQGIPWVNTIAADSKGKAYYADMGAIPNVSDSLTASCNTALGLATSTLLGLPVLDGSRSSCEWQTDPDSVQPGTFGPSHEPSLFRDDYVTNSNNSYWLSNPAQPLEGYARIIGDERTPRSLRTRLGLKIVEQRLAGTDGLPGNRFDRQQVQDAVFNDRQYAGELWRDQLVALCSGAPGGYLLGTSGPVNVSEACPVLANWDLHMNLDSKGAILFQRFATKALARPLPVSLPYGLGNLLAFTTPFDASDPVNTPSGLNTLSPTVIAALADAISDLRSSGIPLDGAPREYQYTTKNGEKIPIHGGRGDPEGSFNAINANWVAGKGYASIPHGSSFVQVTQFTDGCPDDRAILTYSQSEDPTSPYYADQTRMFSNKEWVNPPFCENEIAADPSLRTVEITNFPSCFNLIRGTNKPDKLRGSVGGDRIQGRAGADKIKGRAGNDCIAGGPGRDRINCGPGRDTVIAGPGDKVRNCERVKRKRKRKRKHARRKHAKRSR